MCGEKVKIYPEEYVQGKYGRGPVDFCLMSEKIIISDLEVKKDDFNQGVAQLIVQLHSSIGVSKNINLTILVFIISLTFSKAKTRR